MPRENERHCSAPTKGVLSGSPALLPTRNSAVGSSRGAVSGRAEGRAGMPSDIQEIEMTHDEFATYLDESGYKYNRTDAGIEVLGGNVYLNSLTNERQTYRGQTIRLKTIDDYTMLILSERTVGDNTIYHAAYFGGGDLDKLKRCYVASNGEYHAHGRTVELALRDLRFKLAERDFDEDEIVAEIKARGTVLIEDFRLITGACEEGTRRGMADAGLDPEANELPLPVVLGAAFGSYGDKFKSLFREVV